MARIRLHNLSGVRTLSARELADTRGGLTAAQLAAIAVIGFAVYKVGAWAVSQGYMTGIRKKLQELFNMAHRPTRPRTPTDASTGSSGHIVYVE
jgi:hypothetical protein